MKGTFLFRWPWRCMVHLSVLWIISPKNMFIFSTIYDWKVFFFFFFFFFCIQFFRQHVNIVLQCALVSVINRKITLVGDACSRPLITFRSHDLHVSDIRGVVGEITSSHERTSSLPFLVLTCSAFVGLPFVLCMMVPAIDFFGFDKYIFTNWNQQKN